MLPKGRDRLTLPAAALAVGALAGWSWPWLPVWILLSMAAACAGALLILRERLPLRAAVALLLLGAMCFGAVWPIARHSFVADDDLALYVEAEPALARLRGVVLTTPQVRQISGGSMAQFNYQPPWMVFELDAKALVDRHGEAHRVSSKVWVSCATGIPALKPGDVIEAAGVLRAPPRPRNPGEFDMWRFARSQNQSALMHIEHPALLRVMLTDVSPWEWMTRLRDGMRQHASAWLHADMPDSFREGATSHHRAVLTAFLIGERAPELHEVGAAMQRTGLAHILAISGLHLTMLVALVLVVLGAAREPKRWHGVAAIVIVVAYLMLVEVRVPVLRAGVMVSFASLGIVLGRRVSVAGLVSLSLIAMVLFAPGEVAWPGFQLSFGVVYAIIYLSPALRARWFGNPNMLAGATGSMLMEWLKTSVCVSIAAWAVATPIVLYHFGILSPLGAILSVIGVPAAGVVLALGYLKIVLSAILPSAGLLVGAALAWITDALIEVVLWVDKLPGASVALPMPDVVWALSAIGWVAAVIFAREKRWTRTVWAWGAVLAVWLCWPMMPWPSGPALRIDMLAVGDGSCYVIRTGGETIVFDAGTMGDPGSGARVIVPAMRRLGITGVDTVIVSHANLDHFSAMIEVVDAFGADELIVTPLFVQAAEEDAHGPEAALLSAASEREVGLALVSQGDARSWGEVQFEWLHPPEAATYKHVNDDAMVIRITAAGRRVLLCGDIQEDAMQDILAVRQASELAADVLELPHHGGFSEEAVQFVGAVDPRVVMQSTGYARLRRDRWAEALANVERLVTARDGACWVEIADDGAITTGHLLADE